MDPMVTELAVIAFPNGQARLVEAGPGTSVEDVIAVTEAALIIPDNVPEMRL
jgi:acetate CoA/acetoacetate CoA-transferase beta subunit